MDPLQREIYDFIETKYVKSFQNDSSAGVRDFLNRAKLIRLRQAATNPALLLKPLAEAFDKEDFESVPNGGGKLPDEFQDDSYVLSKIRHYAEYQTPKKFIEVKRLFEEQILPVGGKVIVWTIFIQNAKGLQKFFANEGVPARLLIGEVEQSEREAIIDKFNDPLNSEFRVVIANPFAVSESISLHKGCHNAIYMEPQPDESDLIQLNKAKSGKRESGKRENGRGRIQANRGRRELEVRSQKSEARSGWRIQANPTYSKLLKPNRESEKAESGKRWRGNPT